MIEIDISPDDMQLEGKCTYSELTHGHFANCSKGTLSYYDMSEKQNVQVGLCPKCKGTGKGPTHLGQFIIDFLEKYGFRRTT